MTAKGIATIEKNGTYVKDFEGDYTTPCVDVNKECAYVIWEKRYNQVCYWKGVWKRCYQLEKTHFMSFIPYSHNKISRIWCAELRSLEHLQPGLLFWYRTKSARTRIFKSSAHPQIRRRLVSGTGRPGCRDIVLSRKSVVRSPKSKASSFNLFFWL